MTETIVISKHLFGSNSMTIWNVQVGGQGPGSVCSNLNPSPRQAAKVSWIARSIEKLIDQKVGVANISDEALSYVEYASSTGPVYQALVGFNNQTGNFAVTAPESFGERTAISIVFAALMANEKLAEATASLTSVGLNANTKVAIDEITNNLKGFPTITDTNMYIICDAFYYGIAKQDVNIDLDVDKNLFDMTIDRLLQNGDLVLVKNLGDITKIKLPKKGRGKKAKAKDVDEEREKPLSEWVEDYRNGKYFLPYPFNEAQRAYIPKIKKDYVVTESFRQVFITLYRRLKKVIDRMKQGLPYDEVIGKSPINIKLMGKPGTGKTAMVEAIAAGLGMPKRILNCQGRMEEDTILGENKFIDGVITQTESPFGFLFSIGGIICLEEGNLPDADILQGAIGNALANPCVFMNKGYLEQYRHPLTVVFLTMNIGTEGTKPLNQALSSRFSQSEKVEDVGKEEFIKILESGGFPKRNCQNVYKVYQRVLEYLGKYNEDALLSITMRHCITCLELMDVGLSLEDAVKSTFVNEIYSLDTTGDGIADNLMEALRVVM